MKCLKCGRECDQTFCQSCRDEMERYPVRPGTIVQLPKDRSAAYVRRDSNWRAKSSPEEQLAQQRQLTRRLGRALAVLTALLILMGIVLIRVLRGSSQPPVGQNYSTATKTTEAADTTQEATEPTDMEESTAATE